MAEIKDVKLGTVQIAKIYAGETLVFEKVIDTTAPITTPRPEAGTFTTPQTVWLDVNEASTTYYTTDGSTPTTGSTKYVDGIYLDKTTTLKYFSVDTHGNTEAVKTSTYTINVASGWRYVRFIGHGDNTNVATTRLVELQAKNTAGTNFLLNKSPISGETPNTGAAVTAATDGVITHASGSYPIWWMGAGIPTLTYDLGAAQTLSTMLVVMYSSAADPRQTKFIIQVSKDNTNYTTVADYSANTTAQPEAGFTFNVPA